MMYTSKERCTMVTFLLFTLGVPFSRTQRYSPAIPPFSWHLVPPWDYMLREIILKSVTPSPLIASTPHKRPLNASYYGGPVAAYTNDDKNVILSRGNVYRLLNGHWMLCQDGCVDCEPCAVQRDPLFTWILRRIEQPSNPNPTRHDLQLTIASQMGDHFHASNLWRNYYVYVMPRGEPGPIETIRTQRDNGPGNPLPDLENSFSEHHHRSKNPRRSKERDASVDPDGTPQEDNRVTDQETIEKTEKEESPERKHGLGNMISRSRSGPAVEKPVEEVNQLAPRLILGTDQKGQKHLVHVVPAYYPTTTALPTASSPSDYPISPQFVEGKAKRSNNTIPKCEKQTYQQIFRRVFDSLNTHRRSIEHFLESPTDSVDGHRLSEVAGFSWNNRDVNRKSVKFDLNDAPLSPFYTANEGRVGQDNNYHTTYRDMNQANNKMSHSRPQMGFNLNVGAHRRSVRIKPYFVNNANTSRINSPIQSLDNYTVNTIQKSGFDNSFVINSEKINLNDTFVEIASNNSMESSLITKRENGQLFGLERQASGDVNREFEALPHRAFKVIVTSESPVIRGKHETSNRTTVLQITTPKTFANSS